MHTVSAMPDSTLLGQITEFRHDLHAHPELMYEEARTSAKVCGWLAALGIEHKSGLAGGTGVLGYLPATRDPESARTVALRADMDALPISEATGRAYASQNTGVMHACGHDGHTSILVGVAATLSNLGDRPNNVLLVFQPAEEGGAGGRRMVLDGALTGKVLGKPADVIWGLHGFPYLEVGQVATCDGPMLAAADSFKVKVTGRGGHAALPHLGMDPVVCASHLVSALQTIVSRGTDPLDSIVISVPMFHAGTASNVIPDHADLEGTLRTLRQETRDYAKRRIAEVAEGLGQAFGCSIHVEFTQDGYPVTYNDPDAALRFRETMSAVGGVQLMPDCRPVMGGEDFAFYGESGVPACFYWLGLRPRGAQSYPNLHTPQFDFNDEAIPVGIDAMLALALGPA